MNFKPYVPEINDLQPRRAPKPSAFIDASLAPTVPEVSILLDEPIKIPVTNYYVQQKQPSIESTGSNEAWKQKLSKETPLDVTNMTSVKSPKLPRDITSHSLKGSPVAYYTPISNQTTSSKDTNDIEFASQDEEISRNDLDPFLQNCIQLDNMPNSPIYRLQGHGMYYPPSEHSSLNHNMTDPKPGYNSEQHCAETGQAHSPPSFRAKQRPVIESPHSVRAKERKTSCLAQFEKLYNIIKLQNEQIQILRFDFENMKRSCKVEEKIDGLHQKLMEIVDCNTRSGNCKMSEQATQTSTIANPQRVSVGVMTLLSFPPNLLDDGEPCLQCSKFRHPPNLISSLSLPRLEHVRVENQDESSVCSLHLDLREFTCHSESSCSDVTPDASYDDEESDEESPPQPHESAVDHREGWTFYDNALGQINQMLHTPSQTDNPVVQLPKAFDHEQLQQYRVQLAENENETVPKRVMFDAASLGAYREQAFGRESMDDVSAHMNAMALKHLTDQQLSTLAVNAAVSRPGEMASMTCSSDMTVYNNNLSFATMHYMQRYHILPLGSPASQPTAAPLPTLVERKEQLQCDPGEILPTEKLQLRMKKRRQRKTKPDSPAAAHCSSGTSKILDITALKQQPKLL